MSAEKGSPTDRSLPDYGSVGGRDDTVSVSSNTSRNLFAETTQKPSVFQPFKYSLAYEKGLGKLCCGLCKLYFHKYSVVAKVPNHRIIDLHKQWNFAKDGKRYRNPSFLYKMVIVCRFCSQFFSQVEDDPYNDGNFGTYRQSEAEINREKERLNPKAVDTIEGPHAIIPGPENKLIVDTELKRTDIASLGIGRVFQSSDLDSKYAYFAVTAPYQKASKTRREVDPWWEMDFSRLYDIHSIDFSIITGNFKQTITIYITLLDRPYGFEEPFLDKINQLAIQKKEVVLEVSGENPSKSASQKVSWELPPRTTCSVIRIQMKGVCSLSLKRVKVLQGDSKVELDFDSSNNQLKNSFATMSPVLLRQSLQEMMSPEKKKALMYSKKEHTMQKKDIVPFSSYIKDRYHSIDHWKERTIKLSSIFSTEEIAQMYKIIFKYTYDMDIKNKEHAFDESEMLDAGLTQFYPRCDLTELHTRLRSICRWVQTRSHLKILGAMADAPAFEVVADNPTEHMYKLMSIFKRVEEYYKKTIEREAKKKAKAEAEALSPYSPNQSQSTSYSNGMQIHSGTNTKELKGCSWSQFLIIMSLFCTDETHLIPSLAFNITDKTCTIDWEEMSIKTDAVASNAGASVNSFSLASTLMATSAKEEFLPVISKQRLNTLAVSKTIYIPEEFPQHDKYKKFNDEAKADPTIPHYNSSFSEYKFVKFQKRLRASDVKFPRALNLAFAQTLIPKRGQTSHGPAQPVRDKNSDTAKEEEEEVDDDATRDTRSPTKGSIRKLGSMSHMEELHSHNSSFNGGMLRKSPSALSMSSTGDFSGFDKWDDAEDVEVGGWEEDGSFGSYGTGMQPSTEIKQKENVDFFCICALCDVKYPKKTCTLKIMRKHIVQLRSTWNSKLVSKEIRLLDNTISMYNLVRVCTFCSQFFDPDFEGGIAYPVTELKQKIAVGPIAAIRSQNVESKLDKFHDSRYLEKSIISKDSDVFSAGIPMAVPPPTKVLDAPMYVVPQYTGTMYVGSVVIEGDNVVDQNGEKGENSDSRVSSARLSARHNRTAPDSVRSSHPGPSTLRIDTDENVPAPFTAPGKLKGDAADGDLDNAGLPLWHEEAEQASDKSQFVALDSPQGGEQLLSPLAMGYSPGKLPVSPGKEFFDRPSTKESRRRAKRATEIAQAYKQAVASKEEKMLQDKKNEERQLN